MTTFKHDRLLVALFFTAFLHGSAFFLGHHLIRPSFILGPLLILALPLAALPRYRDRVRLPMLLLTIAFVGVAFCYLLFAHDQIQLLDFYYLAALPCTLVAAQAAAERTDRDDGAYMLKVVSWGAAVITVILIYEIATGTQLVELERDYVYASIFNNPNDLATVVVCFMPLVAYLMRSSGAPPAAYALFYTVTAGLIVTTMSRLAFVLFFLFLFMHLLSLMTRRGGAVRLCLMGAVLITGYLIVTADLEGALLSLAGNHNQTVAENAKRLWLFVYSVEEDKSVGGRLGVYQYFFQHLPEALPGFGIKNYGEFFAGSRVMTLAEVNPHSFVVEVVLAFGICGLGFLLTVGTVVGRAFWRSRRTNPDAARALLTTALFFLVASNIPSSIFRLPVIWFPLFFLLFVVLGAAPAAHVTRMQP